MPTPEVLVEETDDYRLWLSTSDVNPDAPGGWRNLRTEWKPGRQPVEQVLRDRAAAALAANVTDQADNATYLAIASPSAAQVAAQVRALTRQSTTQARELTAVIRLLLGLLDSTDGT